MRFFLLLLFSGLPLISLAKTTIKISTLYPPGSEAVVSLQALAQKIAQETDNQLTLKIYPGGVMGDDLTVLRKMRIGQLHGALVSSSTLDSLDVNVSDLSQPFQFDALAQVYKQREKTDDEFKERLFEAGWTGYGPLDGGFSYLMSKNPITSMADLKSAKLWLPNTSAIQKMTRELNVTYLVMNIGDVLTGLDTGVIDTLIAPPSAALTLNWHSRFNYYTETPVIYTWGMLVIPNRVMNKLPQEQRLILQSSLTQWAVELDEKLRTSNQNAVAAISNLMDVQPFDVQDIDELRVSQK